MPNTIQLIVYPTQDIEQAKTFYNSFLDTTPYVDSPYYVGYKVGDLEIGLDPSSKLGPITYIDVNDINASLQAIVKAGGEVVQESKEVGGGLVIAQVKDTSGNIVGLRQES